MPVLDGSIVQLCFVGAERPAWAYLARVRLTYCLTFSSLIPILRATDFIGMPACSAVGEARRDPIRSLFVRPRNPVCNRAATGWDARSALA